MLSPSSLLVLVVFVVRYSRGVWGSHPQDGIAVHLHYRLFRTCQNFRGGVAPAEVLTSAKKQGWIAPVVVVGVSFCRRRCLVLSVRRNRRSTEMSGPQKPGIFVGWATYKRRPLDRLSFSKDVLEPYRRPFFPLIPAVVSFHPNQELRILLYSSGIVFTLTESVICVHDAPLRQ